MGNVIRLVYDNLRSLVAGMGDETRDKAASTFYQLTFVTDDQLYVAYRSSWIASKIVNIPASDAIRKGRDWQATGDQIEPIEAEENRLQFWPKLIEVLVNARLLGGAALLIGTGDLDLAAPLDPAKIGKQGIKYLNVLDRTELTAGELETNMTLEGYGKPRFYTLVGEGSSITVHPSRLAVFHGRKVPMKALAQGIYRGWGESVLEGVFKAVKDADAATSNIASLLFEANVDVINIPDFMASLADPSYAERFHNRLALAAAAKGINGMMILDGAETYTRKQVSFTGLPDVLNSFLQIVSGAADIPITRFLGQSPAGMSATGESDMKNYHDRLQAFQNLDITPALSVLTECLIYSALGTRPPEIFYTWSPLEQMNEKELAEIGKLNAETAQVLTGAGLFTSDELRNVVGNQFVESGFYPGLDKEMATTGVDWEVELGPSDAEIALAAASAPKVPVKDARPMTLYISRSVKNAAQILEWARGEGFTSTLDASDLHVTVIYSKTAVDWIKVGQAWQDEIKIPPGGPRLMERFDGGAVVLQFASDELAWRNRQAKDCGATASYEEYQPHITISYDGAPDDLSAVTPYRGPILLGPEIFAEVDDGWKASVQDEFNPRQPRNKIGQFAGGGVVKMDQEQIKGHILEVAKKEYAAGAKVIALRVDDVEGADKKVGDTLPHSRVWKNGSPTSAVLGGASTIMISKNKPPTKEDVDVAVDLLHGNRSFRSNKVNYFGKTVYLVSGQTSKKGKDLGEAIIPNPKVLAVLGKDANIGPMTEIRG